MRMALPSVGESFFHAKKAPTIRVSRTVGALSYPWQIQQTEKKISVKLDKLPDILKEDGYPDVQAFMRTFREMESVVEQYNRDLAEWERQVSRKPTATAKAQYRPPEKQSALKHLREIQERNKQKPPQRQRKKSFDRDSR